MAVPHDGDATLHIKVVKPADGFHFPKLAAAGKQQFESLRRILAGKAGGRVSASGSEGADSCAPATPTFAAPSPARPSGGASGAGCGAASPLSPPATPLAGSSDAGAPPAVAADTCRPLDPIADNPLEDVAGAFAAAFAAGSLPGAGRWEPTEGNAWDDAAAFRAGWERGYHSGEESEVEDWADVPSKAGSAADGAGPARAALGAAASMGRAAMGGDARFCPTEGNPLDDAEAFAAAFAAGKMPSPAAARRGGNDISILSRLDAGYGNPLEQPGFAAGYEAGYDSE